MLRFHTAYFLAAALLLGLEIIVAAAVHDAIIRTYAGDFLATIFLFCLARSVTSLNTEPALLGALLVSYVIEGLQYVHLLRYLGLEDWRMARIVLGSSFEWSDMLAYTLGACAVWAVARGSAGFRSFQAPKATLPQGLAFRPCWRTRVRARGHSTPPFFTFSPPLRELFR